MTDTTDHGIPASVLEQAAIAANRAFMSNYELVEEHDPDVAEELSEFMIQGILAALPILRPALEAALLKRMIADLDLVIGVIGVFGESQNAEAYRTLLRTYLPTATEGADHE